MITDARARANRKWDARNLVQIGCKLREDQVNRFKAACAANGTTPYAVLKAAVLDYIDEHGFGATDTQTGGQTTEEPSETE